MGAAAGGEEVKPRTSTTCPYCGTTLKFSSLITRHRGSNRCHAVKLASTILPRGLVPVQKPILARVLDAESALRLFGHPCELHCTRTTTNNGDYTAGGMQAWTTPDGFAALEVIEATARLLRLSFPEATRRVHTRADLIAPFETARRLGADDVTLRALLLPIDYVVGSDGKRRPHTSAAAFALTVRR